MNGKSCGTFAPAGGIRLSAAVTVAVRPRNIPLLAKAPPQASACGGASFSLYITAESVGCMMAEAISQVKSGLHRSIKRYFIHNAAAAYALCGFAAWGLQYRFSAPHEMFLLYVILSQKNTDVDGIIDENFREVMIWEPEQKQNGVRSFVQTFVSPAAAA